MGLQVKARRWVRSFPDSSPANAALAEVSHSISEGTFDCTDAAYACPLVDMSLGSKAFSKPRLPFIITPVVDGTGATGPTIESGLAGVQANPRLAFGQGSIAAANASLPAVAVLPKRTNNKKGGNKI